MVLLVLREVSLLMLAALLTLTIGVLLPVVALATVILTPFCDRKTQILLGAYYFGYILTVLEVVA